jgi:hypothetical protein
VLTIPQHQKSMMLPNIGGTFWAAKRDERPSSSGISSKIKQTLPDVQSIWIFGPDGHPQAISRIATAQSLLWRQ